MWTLRDASEDFIPDPITHESDRELNPDNKASSGWSDTIVPEELEAENDDMIVENESPRGGKYKLRTNPTPNFTDEYRYLLVTFITGPFIPF